MSHLRTDDDRYADLEQTILTGSVSPSSLQHRNSNVSNSEQSRQTMFFQNPQPFLGASADTLYLAIAQRRE